MFLGKAEPFLGLAWVQRERKAATNQAKFGAHFTQIVRFPAVCVQGFLNSLLAGEKMNRGTSFTSTMCHKNIDRLGLRFGVARTIITLFPLAHDKVHHQAGLETVLHKPSRYWQAQSASSEDGSAT